jgi:hypothetical protein
MSKETVRKVKKIHLYHAGYEGEFSAASAKWRSPSGHGTAEDSTSVEISEHEGPSGSHYAVEVFLPERPNPVMSTSNKLLDGTEYVCLRIGSVKLFVSVDDAENIAGSLGATLAKGKRAA